MPSNDGVPQLLAMFTEIEEAPTPVAGQSGIVLRRVHALSTCDLFVGLRKPSNTRVFVARFHSAAVPGEFDLPEFRSLNVDVRHEIDADMELLSVMIESPQPAWNDIFTHLVQDLANTAAREADEAAAGYSFKQRLMQWQALLQRIGPTGLTEDEQQGLWGELWCLREIIMPLVDADTSVRSWHGPESADQDFQFADGVAIEVKTTRATGPQLLSISSERQLDPGPWHSLSVLHLSVIRAHGAGQTLVQSVDGLIAALASSPGALELFENKLLASGYHASQAGRYQDVTYSIHQKTVYSVVGGFPRIVADDLCHGVGTVRYLVSTSACVPYAVDIDSLRAMVRSANEQ